MPRSPRGVQIKYVASTTLDTVDARPNSVFLPGDAVRSVADLKAAPGPDLVIIGSGALVRAPHGAGSSTATPC